MKNSDFFMELEKIMFRYERMESLVSVVQMFVAECVDVAGAPEDAVSNALYEIELGMMEANRQMSDVLSAIHAERQKSQEQAAEKPEDIPLPPVNESSPDVVMRAMKKDYIRQRVSESDELLDQVCEMCGMGEALQ